MSGTTDAPLLDPGSPFHGLLLDRLARGPAAPAGGGWDEVRRRVDDAVAALAAGRVVVVADDDDRENEGDLVVAAEHTDTATVSFVLRHTSGLLCVALAPEVCDRLRLPLMVTGVDTRDDAVGPAAPGDAMGTAFTVSVDAAVGTTTGISAADRATTVRALADPATRPAGLRRPGHVFPLRARPGGVLERRGHTEAGVDLVRMAGLAPAALICEVVDAAHSGMARRPQLRRLAARYDLPYLTVSDLAEYRRRCETHVQRVAEAQLPTAHGTWRCLGYRGLLDRRDHVALVRGDVADGRPVPVHVHRECLTGDAFGSLLCGCRDALSESVRRVAEAGRGVVLYLRTDPHGPPSHAAEPVDAALAAQLLADLGVAAVRPVGPDAHDVAALRAAGVLVADDPVAAVTRGGPA